uniref:Uncharacterized protein n=1 Tax=Globisporangium ultimum (strain ATCC 200006 / CBS 805.95 / DAOM BR144) TaxID=431595 RepID=K3WXU2_GLOUD
MASEATIFLYAWASSAAKGFVVSNSTPRGNCPYRFCLHISFSSSYGTMSDFDAFVMDRYESKNDIGSDSFREDGPVPLVAGALNEAELQAMSKNSWTDGSRYNESRKTSWMLYPMSYDTDEIDIVMSFKQLYTQLPDYNGSNASSNGPFYSADYKEQVVLRVTSRLANSFSASTAVLPLVLEYEGSQLVEVNYTSSILYPKDSYISNEIGLDVVFGRKRYGGFAPWVPAQQAAECSMCESQMMSNHVFRQCLESYSAFVRATFEQPEYAFSMRVKVDGDDSDFVTSEITSDHSEDDIERIVKRAIPEAEEYNIDITARVFNNSKEIENANRWNEWLMNEYWYAMSKLSSSSSSSSISSSYSFSGDSSMDAGMATRSGSSSESASGIFAGGTDGSDSAGSWVGGSSSGENLGATSDPNANFAPPQQRRLNQIDLPPPVLYEVPPLTYTVDVVFGNVSVTPVVTGVYSSQNVSWKYHASQVELVVTSLN